VWEWGSEWETAYVNWNATNAFDILDPPAGDISNQVVDATITTNNGFSGSIDPQEDVDVVGKYFVSGKKYRFIVQSDDYARFKLTGGHEGLTEQGINSDSSYTGSGDAYLWDCSSSGNYYMTVWAPLVGNYTVTVAEVVPPSLSINDMALTEGNSGTTKTFAFTVSMSGSNLSGASVNYATADGTATTADNDYVAKSGTLTWVVGDTSTKTISITVNGDDKNEQDEKFYVNLSGASGVTISDSQGTGTIQNDDTTGTNWSIVGVGDFNGDGTSDVLLQNHGSLNGWTGAWLIKNGAFQQCVGFGVLDPAQWSIAGVSDFNGDGTSDVLLQNHGSLNGWTGAWLIKNGAFQQCVGWGILDQSQWLIPATADLDGDGSFDILLQNHGTLNGWQGAWLIKNALFSSCVGLGWV
jgi:hypothetical protein